MTVRAKSIPVFHDATKPFRDAGIRAKYLLPIVPADGHIGVTASLKSESLGKSPGRYDARRDEWRGLFGNFIKEGVPECDAIEFEEWPTESVGVLGRYVPAIDSDAESPEARELVERVLDEVFPDQGYAERLRGKGDRRLYAFECRNPDDLESVVRGRHLSYRLNGVDSKIDVIGYGNQFLAAGLHQNRRDRYEWHRDRDLFELWDREEIALLDNATLNRFLDTFIEELERAGGEVLRQSGGAAIGEDRDYSDQEAAMPLGAVLAGLDRLPNTEANFPHRDDLVGVLAAIRATLGAEAEGAAEDIEAWATRDGWCDGEYFRKCWDSLNRGVRVGRHTLSHMFRQNRIFPDARTVFPDDAKALSAEIKEHQDARKTERQKLLERVALGYVIGRVNTRTDDGALRMRNCNEPGVEFRGLDWWNGETEDPALSLVKELRAQFGGNKDGFWEFVRAMREAEAGIPADGSRCFYLGETKNPLYERGAIVPEPQPDGFPIYLLNMRFQSPVIRFAKNPPKNQARAAADLETILEFMGRVFGPGEHLEYELDTLAYMAQTGKRPGHMLFLQGEHGVGKSIYAAMLVSMFDGAGREQGGQIDGTKLMSEASRRFALAGVEGCRVISIKELPDGSTLANQKAVTAALKQLVDPGPDGDYFQIEQKGKDSRPIRNFARVISTSNYNGALEIETQDRRIFYKACGITQADKPGPEYYADLTAVTLDPTRLATLWRYLQTRDVRGYSAAKAPPTSREKREAQITGISDPVERRMLATIEVFRSANRSLFTLRDFGAIMSAVGENEYASLNGDTDEAMTYDFGKTPALAHRLKRYARPVKTVKTNGVRVATVYGFHTARPVTDALAGASNLDVMDALERDEAENRLSSEHVWERFSGPLKPAERRR